MPRTMTRGLTVLAIVLSAAACRPAPEDQAEATMEDVLSRLVQDSGLPLIDLSVPMDRFNQAPAALEQLAASLAQRNPAIYVMRYYDDTLRSTIHVFDCRPQGIRYLAGTSIAEGPLIREESVILGVEFDALTSTLTLTSDTGTFQLSPEDVTPVGA